MTGSVFRKTRGRSFRQTLGEDLQRDWQGGALCGAGDQGCRGRLQPRQPIPGPFHGAPRKSGQARVSARAGAFAPQVGKAGVKSYSTQYSVVHQLSLPRRWFGDKALCEDGPRLWPFGRVVHCPMWLLSSSFRSALTSRSFGARQDSAVRLTAFVQQGPAHKYWRACLSLMKATCLVVQICCLPPSLL